VEPLSFLFTRQQIAKDRENELITHLAGELTERAFPVKLTHRFRINGLKLT
jgi:hypothetical protein